MTMFLGGHRNLSLISNMTRVNAGFSGCVRRLQVNSKLFDMRKARHVGDALYGVDVGKTVNQSINQSINLYRAMVQRRVLQCGYAESKRNVLRRIFNVLTDGAVPVTIHSSVEESSKVSEQQQRNDEQQCPSCAAELTDASVWMIA